MAINRIWAEGGPIRFAPEWFFIGILFRWNRHNRHTLARHLSLGSSMVRASHRSSEGCGFDSVWDSEIVFLCIGLDDHSFTTRGYFQALIHSTSKLQIGTMLMKLWKRGRIGPHPSLPRGKNCPAQIGLSQVEGLGPTWRETTNLESNRPLAIGQLSFYNRHRIIIRENKTQKNLIEWCHKR